jgi:two-component system CheB/CheR fusion protein
MTEQATTQADADSGLEALLDHVKSSRGFDFSGYKRSSLERRIRKRMNQVGAGDYRDYLDHLEVNPSEFTDLFNTILINVTGFFRDKPAWDYVAEHVLPQLLEDRRDDHPLRVWSAGCASGEEAYTAAMVLAELLGEDELRHRVKIYATDVDEDALITARAGTYSDDQLKSVPDDLLERYFEDVPSGRSFRADLRRSVIFGRNDLVQDAPISRVDLLISRNALMYFTPETQLRILGHFNFALNETGFLFVGKSEMLITHTDLFAPQDLRWRVFRKVPQGHGRLRERLAFATDPAASSGDAAPAMGLRTDAFDAVPLAQVVVDRSGRVTLVNQRARSLFGLAAGDVGRALQDLEISYRPVDLRSALQRAYHDRSAVKLARIDWAPPGGDEVTLEVEVAPVPGLDGQFQGASIHFDDVTEYARLDEEHERQNLQLERAYEELQSTVEELETTNEELQSTNEELETTNEELQATNEELETMNEELQATNDELEAVNDEQRERAADLDRVNMVLEGILGNLGVGIVVLDLEERVQLWNASSTDLWGLRPDEVEGRKFMSLDIGLPVQRLRDPIADALGDQPRPAAVELQAVNRRGRTLICDVQALPLTAANGRHYGALLLMTQSQAKD